MKYGIDISEHNGDIDLAGLKPAFVIIRAGYSRYKDKQVFTNIRKCLDLGIPYGLYWYSYALDPVEAAAEARTLNGILLLHTPDLGVWYDMEDGDGYKRKNGFSFTKERIQSIIDAFMMEVSSDQKGVYLSESWLQYIDMCKYPIWIASWGINDGSVPDRDFKQFYMWQFTSRLNGLNLDGDILIGNHSSCNPKDILYMAIDTLDGLYGNGDVRKARLGIYYETVQNIINEAYKGVK